MKRQLLICAAVLLAACEALAVTRYVRPGNPTAAFPFTSWSTAAPTIQLAINVSSAGDQIIVTNGVYNTGGTVLSGGMSNRVSIHKPVTVTSVNGPEFTIIEGYQVPGITNGAAAIRCVYLTNGAVLSGFTLTNGATRTVGFPEADQLGGGVSCESVAAVVTNCVLVGNASYAGGAGAMRGTLRNCRMLDNRASIGNGGGANSAYLTGCVLWNNRADYGAGAYGCEFTNCTVINNAAAIAGGGTVGSIVVNSILFHNSAPAAPNSQGSAITHSCITPPHPGAGNITNEPSLVDWPLGNLRLQSNSPCINAGNNSWVSVGTDLDGGQRIVDGTVDLGAYEFPLSLPLVVSLAADSATANPGMPVNFIATIEQGSSTSNHWDFGDGTFATNTLSVSHSWLSADEYDVTFRAFNSGNPTGVNASVTIQVITQTVYYVNVNSTNPLPPYASWDTAAATIQDAVDAALPGTNSTVLVTNGTYAHGGKIVFGTLSNRVAVAKPIQLRSVNGPDVTVIQGRQVPGTLNGPGAVRCVYLTNGATLVGFTLTNGATLAVGDLNNERAGGGVLCHSSSVVVSNCFLSGNEAHGGGGGALLGTFDRCRFENNRTAGGTGGGANSATLRNCLLSGNSASIGGGAYESVLTNCTVTGNSASSFGGGVWGGSSHNSILYYNTAPGSGNYGGGALTFSCTTPFPGGAGNFSAPPLFVNPAGDFHLQSNSPCLNSGNNTLAFGQTDLDGLSRFVGTVDVGAYEYATPVPLAVSVSADETNVLAGSVVNFVGGVGGAATNTIWSFGDGTFATNTLMISHTWPGNGDYQVILRAYNSEVPAGVSNFLLVRVRSQWTHYVNVDGNSPVAPYLTWETAATNIQDAIDVAPAASNTVVFVTNGTYRAGGRVVFGALTNRVAIFKPMQVRSINGPGVTTIEGHQVPGSTNGDAAVRCVFLGDGALLSGFTLTNGATRAAGNAGAERSGGAIYCGSTLGVVSNCILTANAAHFGGGGALGATLQQCAMIGNVALTGAGGGANSAFLDNCLVRGNVAVNGGGVYGGAIRNCTVIDNSAGTSGGGLLSAAATNSIIYYNSAAAGPNHGNATLAFSCTVPLPEDPEAPGSNTDAPPLFVNPTNDFHLQPDSPCINAGVNSAAPFASDLDGNPRIVDTIVDLGAYEHPALIPFTVAIQASTTNLVQDVNASFTGIASGAVVTNTLWTFGDGGFQTNTLNASHVWTASGDFTITFVAYSRNHPEGVSTTLVVRVQAEPFYYVDAANANPVAPYATWATAATNIQDAIDAAFPASSSTVIVTNGIYRFGGRIVSGSLSNRVAVYKSITVRSVNGPNVTSIEGYQLPGTTNGDAAVRCVYLTNNAFLDGFTLTNGATRTSGDADKEQCGGALFAETMNGIATNCVLVNNSAHAGGGGALGGSLIRCALIGNISYTGTGGGANSSVLSNCVVLANTAADGGGTFASSLNNCSVAGNSAALAAGGVRGGTIRNSIIYHNTAPTNINHGSASLLHSCTLPPAIGTGNITNEPAFIDLPGGNLRLGSNSFCINMGNNAYAGVGPDLDGNPRVADGTVDMGAYEFPLPVPLLVSITAQYTNVVPGFSAPFQGVVYRGTAASTLWDFGDGTIVSNTLSPSHSWATLGDFPVVFHAANANTPGGVSATVTVHVASQYIYYVNPGNPVPAAPYTSWGTAATDIQSAIDAALPVASSLVLVTNGIYQSGAKAVQGMMSNRVAVTKPITVQSVNGPLVTVIQGHQVPGTLYGNAAVRCVYLTNNARLIGFTLAGGATRASGDGNTEQRGGALWCQSASATASNCILSTSVAFAGGGGSWQGTLDNCSVLNNSAAGGTGGGANAGVLKNCLLAGNQAAFGGGAYACTLTNSTVSGNSATASGGGMWMGNAHNSIVYSNNAPTSSNYFNASLAYSCAAPLPAGPGNLALAPVFINAPGGDFRLASNSPCINAGHNAHAPVGTDLDGNSRVSGGTVDIGAYEFQSPASLLSYAWAQQHGLATDGSADFADTDSDGHNNWQEWRADTVPLDPSSVLKLLNPVTNALGVSVSWQSVTTRSYFLQRSTNLGTAPFSAIRSNIAGQSATTTYIDTNAPGTGPFFYRVGVQ